MRAASLNNLANALDARFRETHDPADLDEAIMAGRSALAVVPADLPARRLVLSDLSAALSARFRLTGDNADITEAIETARIALATTPQDGPELSSHLFNLAMALRGLTDATGDGDARAEARLAFQQAAEAPSVGAFGRYQAARGWAEMAAEAGDWTDALIGYRLAVAQIELVAWHGLDRADRIVALRRIGGIMGDIVAVALNAGRPEEAIVLMEQARGVLLSQVLSLRSDRTELSRLAPELAERMDQIRAALDITASSTPLAWSPMTGLRATPGPGDTPIQGTRGMQDITRRNQDLAREWDSLVTRARQLPGLENFLRPASYPELCRAGDHGPIIIINLSRYRCDAVILSSRGLTIQPLLDVTLKDAAKRVSTTLVDILNPDPSQFDAQKADNNLADTLAWLWDTIVEPALTALGFTSVPNPPAAWPRLWWCPVGPASFLPLHAAGHLASSMNTVMGRAVSSYAPTLRALIDGRARTAIEPIDAREPALAVALPSTEGLPDLPAARLEIRHLQRHIPNVTTLTGPDASRQRILEELPKYPVFHFAGHGQHDLFVPQAEPALYPYDHNSSGPLTASDLAELHLDTARLAFLSACQTAVMTLEVPDEQINLAGALQLAGFVHVIATQWSISDSQAPAVADRVYGDLAQHGDIHTDPDHVALALHRAVRELRDRYPSAPTLWAPYIHVGP
jgi:hypothetical protein